LASCISQDGFDELQAASDYVGAAGDDGLSGAWRHPLEVFELKLPAGTALAFRIQRDVIWSCCRHRGTFRDVLHEGESQRTKVPDGNGAQLQWRRRRSW
jgi:hypothetical protein